MKNYLWYSLLFSFFVVTFSFAWGFWGSINESSEYNEPKSTSRSDLRESSTPSRSSVNKSDLIDKSINQFSGQDRRLVEKLRVYSVSSQRKGPSYSEEMVELGKKLFFDKILSGRGDISCATCHNPRFGTTDGLSLAIGTGFVGEGLDRKLGKHREFVARNTPDLFNRGDQRWTRFFWDTRIRKTKFDSYITSFKKHFPGHVISHLLGAQAIADLVASRGYRGRVEDLNYKGELNDLAFPPRSETRKIWGSVRERILAIGEYRNMLGAAFPDKRLKKLKFEHLSNAIAAFQIEAFTFLDSPWDRYLRGDTTALTPLQKEGALLFYGEANCAACHSGPLMTDQEAYNIAVPPLGTGAPAKRFLTDLGLYHNTFDKKDLYKFRTPPLRNVTVTGPWMHNGAYKSLEGAIRHHVDPLQSFQEYDPSQLERNIIQSRPLPMYSKELENYPKNSPDKSLAGRVHTDTGVFRRIRKTVSPKVQRVPSLSDEKIELLITFLKSATSPSVSREEGLKNKETPGAVTQELYATIPDTVPSDIPIGIKPGNTER